MRPDTSLTFADLIRRVAETAGIALYYDADDPTENAAKVPTDPHDLLCCKDAVNDALAEFYLRRSWSFLKPPEEITLSTDGTGSMCVDGDPRRYKLPWYIQGQPASMWEFSSGTARSGLVQAISPAIFRSISDADTESAGYPAKLALVPSPKVVIGQRRGWEVHVYPTPDQEYTLVGHFDIEPARLEVLEDRVLCAARHDATILAMARVQILRTRGPQELLPAHEMAAATLLEQSVAFDAEPAAEQLPQMNDPGLYREQRGEPAVFPMTQYTIGGVTYPASM